MAREGQVSATVESGPHPYAPSWIDRFSAWVDRLPGPSAVYYCGLGLVLVAAQAAALWAEGAHSIGSLPPIHLFFAAAMPFVLALFHVLDNVARGALSTLKPALNTTEAEYEELCYRLTTLPAWPTLLAGLGIVAVTFAIDAIQGFGAWFPGTAPVSEVLVYLTYKTVWWVFGTLAYHTIHQLRLINRILTRHTHINPFRVAPLYAFSRLTALTAVGLALPPYGFFALQPELLQDLLSLVQGLLIMALAIVVFVWPLLGIRRLLARKKEQMLDDVSRRLEAAFADLHRRMDGGELDTIDNLGSAIDVLQSEQSTLKGIATWPWQPETVRYLVSALFLPLILWIIQYALQGMMEQ